MRVSAVRLRWRAPEKPAKPLYNVVFPEVFVSQNDYPRRWLRLKTRDLIPKINALGLDFPAAEALLERIRQDKRSIRSVNGKAAEHRRRWAALIRAVRAEQDLVRRGLVHYQQLTDNLSVSSPRHAAMQAYHLVLTETVRRMQDARNDPQGLLPPAYKGDRWTDWIPKHIQARVHLLFDAIPHDGKRIKKPFPPVSIRDTEEDRTRAHRKARIAKLTDKVSVSSTEGEK